MLCKRGGIRNSLTNIGDVTGLECSIDAFRNLSAVRSGSDVMERLAIFSIIGVKQIGRATYPAYSCAKNV
jgi:hypothetical protein